MDKKDEKEATKPNGAKDRKDEKETTKANGAKGTGTVSKLKNFKNLLVALHCFLAQKAIDSNSLSLDWGAI